MVIFELLNCIFGINWCIGLYMFTVLQVALDGVLGGIGISSANNCAKKLSCSDGSNSSKSTIAIFMSDPGSLSSGFLLGVTISEQFCLVPR